MEYIFLIPPKKSIDDSLRTVYPPYVSSCSALATLRMRHRRTDRTSPYLCSCWFPLVAQHRTTRKIEPPLQEAAEVCALPKYCLKRGNACTNSVSALQVPMDGIPRRSLRIKLRGYQSDYPSLPRRPLLDFLQLSGSRLRSKRIEGMFTPKARRCRQRRKNERNYHALRPYLRSSYSRHQPL
jgi:hypothetical protein